MTTIRTRNQWGAEVPLSPHMMQLPAVAVYLHHSATLAHEDDPLTPTDDTDNDIRRIEAIGKQRFGRMSYSWLVHPHEPGVVYEGAGLTVGAHTANRNSTTFGLNFVGNYDTHTPTLTQVEDAVWIIRHLIITGNLRPDYELRWHSQEKATSCPGKNLVALASHIRNRTNITVAPPATTIARRVPVDAVLPILNLGDTSRDVAVLQSLLKIKGAQKVELDGVFGRETALAVINVKRFFFGNDKQHDPIVGPEMWSVLLTI